MNIFAAASDAALRVSQLTWIMIAISAAVYATLVAATVIAVARNRQRDALAVDLTDRSEVWIIIGGVVLPALILLATFVASLKAMARSDAGEPALTIQVVGHQWWWELQYHPGSARTFAAANEIHIPVGKSVRLLLTSDDVIHSFWVPELQGKLDVNPGDTNDLRLQAQTRGTYRGKCAEFCGAQHTNMGITVVAEDSADYAHWEQQQLQVAAESVDSTAASGRQIFAGATCVACHTIRGTIASARIGPDLTHVASRQTIGAGVLAMQPGNVEGWIANAPAIKPGVHMPAVTGLSGSELRALAAYIASLR